METAIKINNISRGYGKVLALNNVSLDIGRGELFGLIGPDGAGKTTLFRILATLIMPGSGSISMNGMDVVRDYKKLREDTGYMPGQFSLYKDLTVEENLSFFASVFGTSVEENYHLIKDIYCMLEPFKKRRAAKLSGGMKQKLALCCALIHCPSVLLLDEPTTGVDPVSRREFWEMLHGLRERNITVVVSTPYMDEANMCDRIALLSNGEILNVDTPANLVAGFGRKLWSVKGADMYRLLIDIRGFEGVESAYSFGENHHVCFKDDNQDIDAFRKYLAVKGHTDVEIKEIAPNIEDCYMLLS